MKRKIGDWLVFNPGGIAEISRWREPPEPVRKMFQPRRGGGRFRFAIDSARRNRLRGDAGLAVLRRENDVEMEREVGRWHGGGFRCPCRGTGSLHTGFRWLAPPANFTCPCRGRYVAGQSLTGLGFRGMFFGRFGFIRFIRVIRVSESSGSSESSESSGLPGLRLFGVIRFF